jgi:outer membrane lipoprotein SlyB
MRNLKLAAAIAALMVLAPSAWADGNGVVTGAAGGAVTGAVVGGPVGAAVGGAAGAVVGGAVTDKTDTVVVQPQPCRTTTVQKTDGFGDTTAVQKSNCP